MLRMRNLGFKGFFAPIGLMLITLGALMNLSHFALASKLKTVTISLTTEPPNLDSGKATDQESFLIIGHVMEGLTSYDSKGEIIPGVAEKWEITEKGATFHLRKNARWSDGKPVQAQDFIYSWKRVVDPKTASEYSFIIYPIKNAELINQGKLPVDQLGAVAKDPLTIEITFERPTGYFLGLTAFATYYPFREDFIKLKKDKYASSPENMLYNGPFKLTKWIHGSSLKMEKNEMYWNKNKIKLDVIDIPYITPDATARFNLFKTQKIDIIQQLSKETLANAQKENFKLKKHLDGSVFYTSFNFRKGRLTANKNLRMALLSVFNPTEYLSRVVSIPGTLQPKGLVPSYLKGVDKKFRQEFTLPPHKFNIAAGKEYLNKAMKELGLSSPPSLVYLTGDTELATREAEYFQASYKTHLGIDLKIDKQIFKQRLAKAQAGDYDIVSEGWGPDYSDPMTFVDIFTSWNGNNKGKWFNDAYDAHVRTAMNTMDPKSRMSEMAAAEKLLFEDAVIIPLYERSIMFTQIEKLKGIARHPVGLDLDLREADIVE